MRHGVSLRDIRHGLIGQRLGKQPASRCHHSTPKEIRINRKSQACLPAYTTADRRAPNFFGKPSAMRRSLDCRGEKKCAKRRFLDLKNRRSRSGASGAYLSVREDGSRTGSAIFVAKKRRKQPHCNQHPRTRTDNSCVQRPRTS